MRAPKLTEAQRALLNAATAITEGPHWPGNSSDMIQITRADYNALVAAVSACGMEERERDFPNDKRGRTR